MMHRGPATFLRPRAVVRSPRAAAAGPAIAGLALVMTGSAVAWLLVTTPMLHRLADPFGRGSTPQVAWVVAVVLGLAPVVGCILAGVARLGLAVDLAWARGIQSRLVSRMAHRLPPDCVVFPIIWLPDGRSLAEVVVGPFGVVVFAPLPMADRVRHLGASWEERDEDGTWRPAEHPARRVSRDAERLRHLLAGEERDFVVRVHAALVGADVDLDPSSGVALVEPAEVPGWLAGLRPQRSLDRNRLAHVRDWIARLT